MQKYGQHFLTDQNIIAQIVDATLLLRAPQVIEIGPGKGALTKELVARGLNNFTAVEIDPDMVSFLRGDLPAQASVKIIEQNFLEFDLNSLPAIPTIFVSNLPYIDAAEILDKVLSFPHFKTAVFMFQKEQAQKIRARVGDNAYGPLSIFSQLRARVSLVCKVGRGAFVPPPKVESAVLAFERISPPEVAWGNLCRVVSTAFLHRRKTLLNALTLAGYEKGKTSAALTSLRLPLTIRPEEVTPDLYVRLTKILLQN